MLQIWLRFSFACLLFVSGNASFADPGNEAVISAQNNPLKNADELSSGVVPASVALSEYLSSMGLGEGMEVKDGEVRVISFGSASTKISKLSRDFMAKRRDLALRAQLMAKTSLIETISTNADLRREFTVTEDPVMVQLQEIDDQYEAALEEAEAQAELAKAEVVALMKGVDEAQSRVIEGATYTDKLMALLDASIKKLDETYDKSELDQSKKARLDDLKKRLSIAKDYEKQANSAKTKIEQLQEEIKSRVVAGTQASLKFMAEMPMWGATAIASADSYDELNGGILEVAVAMVWSKKLQRNAIDVLQGKKLGENFPAKLSLSEWLDSQDLAVMVGPRRYLAKDGSINFIGIAASEIPRDPNRMARVQLKTRDLARGEAILSVLSEVKTVRSTEEVVRDVAGDNGEISSEIFESINARMSEEFKGEVRGLSILKTVRTTHPATGKKILVVVAGIDSSMVHESPELMADTYALLKEFNAKQSVAKGVKQGLKDAADATKNNERLIDQGRSQGQSTVDQKYQDAVSRQIESIRPNNSVNPSAGSSNDGGTFISKGALERDF